MSTPQVPPNTPPAEPSGGGFMAAMFDFEFETFVALKFIKVIYILAMVFIGLSGVALFFVGIANGDFLTALAALVFLVFYLIVVRVWLEVIALLFRIGENTSAIRASVESN